MYLEILTPGKKVFTGDIKLIKVPGSDGSFEVMEKHAPIISTLQPGKLKFITTNGQKQVYDIQGGVVQVLKNHVIVLVESLVEA